MANRSICGRQPSSVRMAGEQDGFDRDRLDTIRAGDASAGLAKSSPLNFAQPSLDLLSLNMKYCNTIHSATLRKVCTVLYQRRRVCSFPLLFSGCGDASSPLSQAGRCDVLWLEVCGVGSANARWLTRECRVLAKPPDAWRLHPPHPLPGSQQFECIRSIAAVQLSPPHYYSGRRKKCRSPRVAR